MPKSRTTSFFADYLAENAVRRAAYGLGLRYRVRDASMTGTPHFVFRGARVLVWAIACDRFHHECHDELWPPTSTHRERDARGLDLVLAVQRSRGWTCEVVTPCRSRDGDALKRRLQSLVHVVECD